MHKASNLKCFLIQSSRLTHGISQKPGLAICPRRLHFTGRAHAKVWRKDELGRGADPGSWNFSPEWMGTQNGGWGHNAGDEIFSEHSFHGNGLVTVTRHYLSKQDLLPLFQSAVDYDDAAEIREQIRSLSTHAQSLLEEWRVLRFNNRTVQSVARVIVGESEENHEIGIIQRGDCMAFLYMQSIGAAVASLIGLAPSDSSLRSALEPIQEGNSCKVLCIGLGGGTLPLFLLHHFPGMIVDVVELDEAVIKAAQYMGFPQSRPRLQVHRGDAAQWLRDHCAKNGSHFDLIFVDAFDGNNHVPEVFTQTGQPFLSDLQGILHPKHGAVLVNLHRGELPPLWKQVSLKLQGKPWIDPLVEPIAQVYKDCVTPQESGKTYTLQVGPQYNVLVVSARGSHLVHTPNLEMSLKQAASEIATKCKYRYSAADKSVLDFREL